MRPPLERRDRIRDVAASGPTPSDKRRLRRRQLSSVELFACHVQREGTRPHFTAPASFTRLRSKLWGTPLLAAAVTLWARAEPGNLRV